MRNHLQKHPKHSPFSSEHLKTPPISFYDFQLVGNNKQYKLCSKCSAAKLAAASETEMGKKEEKKLDRRPQFVKEGKRKAIKM